jgi:hypothetical protein
MIFGKPEQKGKPAAPATPMPSAATLPPAAAAPQPSATTPRRQRQPVGGASCRAGTSRGRRVSASARPAGGDYPLRRSPGDW